MKRHEHRPTGRRLERIGLALLALIAAGAATAQTYQSGGSTTVIEQKGGGASQSRVTVYPDGQKVISRDGQSTDISIQRGSTPSSAAAQGADRSGEREERLTPRRPSTEDRAEGWPSFDLEREAFRERMIERMRRYSRF